jgi:peptidyl-prolyl cis-trans isomerase C
MRSYAMIRTYAIALIGVLVFFLGAGAWAAEVGPAARVNGVEIPRARLEKAFNAYLQQRGIESQSIRNPEQGQALQRQVLDVLIVQELLWQEAKRKNFIVQQEEVDQALARIRANFPSQEAFFKKLEENGLTQESYVEDVKRRLSVRQMIQQDIAKGITVSDQEVHDFYLANPDKLTRPEQIRVRHILIKVDSAVDQATKQAARQKIDAILVEARGGADFAVLARQYSEGPSGPQGGDLGFFGRGQMAPPFEEAAFAMQPGEISGVVETRFGYHIIKLEERREAALAPEQEMAGRIRDYLQSVKVQQALEKRVQSLRQAGTVEILMAQ